jgi:hypothetical protein
VHCGVHGPDLTLLPDQEHLGPACTPYRRSHPHGEW